MTKKRKDIVYFSKKGNIFFLSVFFFLSFFTFADEALADYYIPIVGDLEVNYCYGSENPDPYCDQFVFWLNENQILYPVEAMWSQEGNVDTISKKMWCKGEFPDMTNCYSSTSILGGWNWNTMINLVDDYRMHEYEPGDREAGTYWDAVYIYHRGDPYPTTPIFDSNNSTPTGSIFYYEYEFDPENEENPIVFTDVTLPTCFDDILNQNETSIDEGGYCPHYISSDVSVSTTLQNENIYVIEGDIEIEDGVTLTIEPGTIIKFTEGSSLIVNGVLDSIGSSETNLIKQIYLTSIKDDKKRDTNGDGSATSPSLGDWDGIVINQGGEANLTYTTIRYAGGGSSGAQIHNNGGDLNIEYSLITHGTDYGILNSAGDTEVYHHTEITNNDYGVYVEGGNIDLNPFFSILTADEPNIIHDNAVYGVYNDTVSSIDARYIYWGAYDGPDGEGEGTGDAVSLYVDFDPWKEYLHFYNTSGNSVDNGEIRWWFDTIYSDEFDDAVGVWDSLNSTVNINQANSRYSATLWIVDIEDPSSVWAGLWTSQYNPDYIYLNDFYLKRMSSDMVQSTITHELGHALGLGHSYTDNIMYFTATDRTILGYQDLFDYYSLWP